MDIDVTLNIKVSKLTFGFNSKYPESYQETGQVI